MKVKRKVGRQETKLEGKDKEYKATLILALTLGLKAWLLTKVRCLLAYLRLNLRVWT